MTRRKKSEYEELRDKWYAVLKKDGFVDIEHKDGSINQGVPRSKKYRDPDLRQITQDYYCMTYYFLNSYEFKSELEKVIWEYHANGLSVRSIAKILKDTKVSTISKNSVWAIIKRLQAAMKAKCLSV